jgi:hypothetical protein
VPRYACHLRAGLRHTTYQIFFEQLLAQVGLNAGDLALDALLQPFNRCHGCVARKATEHGRLLQAGQLATSNQHLSLGCLCLGP